MYKTTALAMVLTGCTTITNAPIVPVTPAADMAEPARDLTPPADMTTPADLTPPPPDLTPPVYTLAAGTYKITSITNKMDGCTFDSDPSNPVNGSTVSLMSDGNGTITIQNYGTGVIHNNAGTLSAGGQVTAGSCTYSRQVTTGIMVTANNTIAATYAETDSNRLTTCTPSVGVTCMSSWNMTLSKLP